MLVGLLLSCVGTNPSYDSDALTPDQGTSEVWVCHHPGTEYHDKICIEAEYPNGCFVRDDNSKFCWRLTREECEDPDHGVWAKKACKLFE